MLTHRWIAVSHDRFTEESLARSDMHLTGALYSFLFPCGVGWGGAARCVVAWSGVVWWCAAWRGAAWRGVAWRGGGAWRVVWLGVARRGLAWRGVAWFVVVVRCGLARGLAWRGAAWGCGARMPSRHLRGRGSPRRSCVLGVVTCSWSGHFIVYSNWILVT